MKRSSRALAAGAAAAALVGLTPGAASAVTTSSFYVSYGASVLQGEVRWGTGYTSYVSGSLKAVSATRKAQFTGVNGYITTTTDFIEAAAGTTKVFTNVQVKISVAGGVQKMYIDLWADGAFRGSDVCTRTSSYCSSL